MERLTTSPKSYEPIRFKLTLRDEMGLFNTEFLTPLRLQIFFSTYKADEKEIIKNNEEFICSMIEMEDFGMSPSMLKVNEIVETRLSNFDLSRYEQNPSICDLQMTMDRCGKYYFYAMLEDHRIYYEEIDVEMSDKERELEEKNKEEMKMRD